eukprot:g29715.t1
MLDEAEAWRLPETSIVGYWGCAFVDGKESKISWRSDTLSPGQRVAVLVTDEGDRWELYPVLDIFAATVAVELVPEAIIQNLTGDQMISDAEASSDVWQDLRDLMEQYASESGLKMEAFLALVEDRRRVFGERDRALRLFSALDVKDQGFLDVKSFHELCLETCRPLGAQSTELFRDMDRSKATGTQNRPE